VVNQVTYSNPRISARIDDVVFEIEMDAERGQRAIRYQTNKTRKLPFARFMRIVDGDDGKLYIVVLSFAGNVIVWRDTMRRPHEIVQADEMRHSDLLTLFVRENV
jgi:hypothetical protein